MAGYIKLHRGLLEWGWYKDANTMRVFMDILLHANYADGEYMGHPIKAGQCVVGRKALADRLGMSERSVRTALSHLKTTNEITIKTTNKFSIVSVVNWDKYQFDDDVSDQQPTNNRPTTDQQPTTSKKERRKEIKNIYVDEFEDVWENYPKKHGKQEAKKHYIKARNDGVSKNEIEQGIAAYKTYIKATGTEDRYIKAGSSFFCQRAWENDWTVKKSKLKSNVYQPEPPKYPMFEPEPDVDTEQMPEEIRNRLKGIFA